MKNYKEYNGLQQFANAFAREEGFGKATKIVVRGRRPELIERVSPGYRKNSTGEYVPNSYRNNFGWKNTYYQEAITVIAVPQRIAKYFEEA